MNESIPDGIYYIVFADLVGSTKFGAEMGNAALAARIQIFIEASKTALNNIKIGSNSGRFVKSVGDGVLMVFNHFPDIVQWQLEFHGALILATNRNKPFEWRVCVHAGEVRFEDSDPFSLASNQLFKIEKKVNASEVVLSEIAHNLALPSVYPKWCEFIECGEVRLDGYNRLVNLHRLILKADFAFLVDKTAHGEKQQALRKID
jgi:class 3 adenylate cyclase